MCSQCFDKEYASFPNYWGFEQFDVLLTQKLQAPKGLRYVGVKQIEKTFSTSTYKCETCGTTWQLSEPDNAWRSFFLTEANAAARLNKTVRNDKLRSLGCLAGAHHRKIEFLKKA